MPANRPNVIDLDGGTWTQVRVDRPSLVIPMTTPTGYLLAYPGVRRQNPVNAATERYFFFDTYTMPGGLTCYLPEEGNWSIYNSGADVTARVIDADHPAVAMMNCGDGAYATAQHTTASASTVSATALVANQNAIYRCFVNDGTVPVYLSLANAAAVANQGIRLNANGGSYEMSKKAGNLYKGLVTCITASGTATVLVTEGGIAVPT